MIRYEVERNYFMMGAIVFVGLVILLVAIGAKDEADKKETRAWFMQECMRERAEYECFAMWKTANPAQSSTVVVPMPVVIPR